jgi:ribosomal protein S18 acetylase RimI-like enzyme
MIARLLRDLAPFSPTLVGTYPLGLQVDGSDLDIACTADDLDAFERALQAILAELGCTPTRLERVPLAPEAVVAELVWEGLPVEIFCQSVPIHAQAGFRHLVIEGQLLVLGGELLRERVRALKRAGVKTEPAFAQVLGLRDDPYAAVLALERWPPDRLRRLVDAARSATEVAEIAIHHGDRAVLMPLFLLADDSHAEIAGYLASGTVLVATQRGQHVGHVQMIDDPATGTCELKSLAVVTSLHGTGLGRRLVEAGLDHARRSGARTVVLSTGTADTDLLHFYQRRGFRLRRIDRDIFTPAAGYPPEILVNGVRLLDRVWLDIDLLAASQSPAAPATRA